MGSLLGHITAFSIIFPLAIQRLWSSLSLQAQSSPSDPFKPRPWYFSTFTSESDHHLRRNATIYLSLLLLPITIFASLHPISTRHVASLILFFLLLALILLADSRRLLLLPDGALFFLSAFVFLADSALSNPNNSTAHFSEVDSHLRPLTMGPTLVCAVACVVLAFVSSGSADVALSIALALKGSWELQVGLTFYVLKLRGCSTAGGVRCELHEDATRGMHTLDLLFSAHAFAIASLCLGMQWIAAKWVNRTAETDAMLTRLVQISTSDLEFD
ncbi:hypothetical protein LUZ63_011028 [Rhynchospora breviuscula]|uniref:Uncharacterized protein n=1 Tax=Rhynchospora breviuscula TaxID=2022672 RepID=A0A9Q0CI75_9POAL|nr:hypothetical protein LUZ63_011028 [Rhynchospora breviuscula]